MHKLFFRADASKNMECLKELELCLHDKTGASLKAATSKDSTDFEVVWCSFTSSRGCRDLV